MAYRQEEGGGHNATTYQQQSEQNIQSIRQQQDQAHPHAGKGSPKGGQFVKKGTGSGGNSGGNSGRGTRTTTHPTNKPAGKPAPPTNRHRAMHTGDTGSDVAELNGLLSKLGLAHTGDSSTYLPSTSDAVMDAQRRLGLKPTGKASAALLRKLHAAVALSPCIKRSDDDTEPSVSRTYTTPREDPDRGGAWEMPDLTRAAMSTMDINDLPDSAFAYIEDGGTQDEQGRTTPRSLRHFPVHDEEHVRDALARMSQSPFGGKAAKKIHKAAKRMGIGDYDNEQDEPMGPEGDEHMHMGSRSTCCPDHLPGEAHVFRRDWALDGIDIIRGAQGGDGRTVEAYATPFGIPTEVKDQHGHYMETIDPRAFDEALRGGFGSVRVFYNHGMNIHGQPSDLFSIPIGRAVDVRPDGRGLRTITRYNEGDIGDSILEAIRNKSLTGYSFRGPIRQSNPPRVPRARDGQPLPNVTRTKLGLTEYGPTPMPYYTDASIIALRSKLQRLQTLDDSVFDRLVEFLAASTPQDQEAAIRAITATPNEGLGAEDQPAEALRSASMASIRRRTATFRILGGIK